MDELRCPICNLPLRPPTRDAHPHFPFCGKRCQLTDLSRWFGGEYSLSDPIPPEPGPDETDEPS